MGPLHWHSGSANAEGSGNKFDPGPLIQSNVLQLAVQANMSKCTFQVDYGIISIPYFYCLPHSCWHVMYSMPSNWWISFSIGLSGLHFIVSPAPTLPAGGTWIKTDGAHHHVRSLKCQRTTQGWTEAPALNLLVLWLCSWMVFAETGVGAMKHLKEANSWTEVGSLKLKCWGICYRPILGSRHST